MKFLIIDDNPADRELAINRLRREFENAQFMEVGRPADLEEVIARDNFDFVLTDYQLNWATGLEIFQRLQKVYPEIPIIMFTGTGNEEVAVQGLRAGLSNYILKKNLDQLPFAIRESLEKTRLRKQYEVAIEQLRLSEERYRELFDQGLTGIFAFTPSGRLLTCNAAFAHIFGFSSVAEAMQTNLRDLYPQPQQFALFLDLLARQKRLEYHEMELRRDDGEPVYVVASVIATFDEAENLEEIKGYFFDNTEQHRLTQQLQQAQKLESVGLLVSGIAHDFNNMLGGILGYTSRGMERISKTHPLYDNLYHIREITMRATKMTRQLLAFSRRQVLEPVDVNLNTVVENLLNFLGKLLADHIEIEFVPGEDLQTVHVDYAQIEQVLMNLCINARDAMPDGGTLTIRTHNVQQDEASRLSHGQTTNSPYILLSVQDTGVGMDEQTRERIFEPFFTTKEFGKGTGLGLSMVHGIVGQHNGYIDVQSEVGKGTIFSIYLPAVDVIPVFIAASMQERTPRAANGAGELLLVVEDDPDIRFLIEEALGEYGYRVVSACDGLEGLHLFEEHGDAVSLVIADLMTPKMKGKELYDKIRQLNRHTRFLFISGYQTNQISQNFVLDKNIDFLPKPFDLDELAAKVQEVLS